MKEQIEKMACDICVVKHICNEPNKPMGTCYALKCAKRAYEAGYRKQSEWISVEDRLPRESEVVLAYSSKFGVIQRIYTTYKEEIRWWSDEYWSSTEQLGITHWMPLPEPPKMKGGAE